MGLRDNRSATHLNNIYIKTLGLPVCSAFPEVITGHLVGYYTSLNLHGTESGKSFISGNHSELGPTLRHTKDCALPVGDSHAGIPMGAEGCGLTLRP